MIMSIAHINNDEENLCVGFESDLMTFYVIEDCK